MKNNFNLALMLLIFNSYLIAQSDFSLDIRNFENSSQLWTDNQVWQFTQKFGIQDTFFKNNRELKEKFIILRHLTNEDLDKYCHLIKDSGLKKYEFDNYYNAMKSDRIIKINDWLSLLARYPSVMEIFANKLANGKLEEFNSLIQKLYSREKLIFVDNGSVVMVDNTRESYSKFKHLKRLK
ncbi:MAG: hypothetical protein ACM3PT_11175 [Deltaproteobacteria bacterium]